MHFIVTQFYYSDAAFPWLILLASIWIFFMILNVIVMDRKLIWWKKVLFILSGPVYWIIVIVALLNILR